MIAVGHTAVGIIVGVGMGHLLPASMPLWEQVVVTGAVGIGSHYVMDLVPHGHYNFDTHQPSLREKLSLIFDLVAPLAVVAILIVWRHGLLAESWLIGSGIVGAQLPDLLNGFEAHGWIPMLAPFRAEHRFHLATHWHNPSDLSVATHEGGRRLGWSDIWQAGIIFVAVYFLLSL